MNNPEFSNEFDVLYNNITSNQAPGLNEYEKSVLLTKAQNEIVKNYFNPKGNKYQEGFDSSAKRQIDFSELTTTSKIVTTATGTTYDKRGKLYSLPDNLMIIIQESVDTNNGTLQVVPIRFDEYMRLMSKPYKEPLKWQAWRLITDSSTLINAEIIAHSSDVIDSYNIRYIRKPRPIVLVDLSTEYGDLTIDGVGTASECELNSEIHPEILQRAVEMAKVIYTGDANSMVQIGQRSE